MHLPQKYERCQHRVIKPERTYQQEEIISLGHLILGKSIPLSHNLRDRRAMSHARSLRLLPASDTVACQVRLPAVAPPSAFSLSLWTWSCNVAKLMGACPASTELPDLAVAFDAAFVPNQDLRCSSLYWRRA